MSTLDALIRVRKFELDEKRRFLKGLETIEDEHKTALVKLGEELLQEQKVASASQEGAYAYGPSGRVVIQRREDLDRAIIDIGLQFEVAREELAAAFSELKKFEITKESRERAAAIEEGRREQAVLDELDINTQESEPAQRVAMLEIRFITFTVV